MARHSTDRILFVDDIPEFAAQIKSILSSAGMEVHTVLSPRRGLRCVWAPDPQE